MRFRHFDGIQVFLDLGVPGIQLHIEELRALARTNNSVAAV
jgi:hypothetical protein